MPIICTCRYCGNQVLRPPSKAKCFKYCSKFCRLQTMKGKLCCKKTRKRLYRKCKIVDCNKVVMVNPWHEKRKFHQYCSYECRGRATSREYKEYLQQLEEQRQEKLKLNIWKLSR